MYNLEIKTFSSNIKLKNQSLFFLEDSLSNYLACPKQELKINKTQQGKPYLESHPHIKFNISHSHQKWAIGISEFDIGVDIQLIKNKDYTNVWTRFFHPQEISYLNELPKQEQIFQFFKIWSLKEAYVKCIGTGIANDFKDTSVLNWPSNFILESQFIDEGNTNSFSSLTLESKLKELNTNNSIQLASESYFLGVCIKKGE